MHIARFHRTGYSETMLRKWILTTIYITFIACFIALGAGTSLPLVSPLFSDNMVMQRGKPNAIWGWSTPGQEVRVQIAGHIAKAITGSDGRWQARVQPPAPGGPYTIIIDGPQHRELHEVLVGDVWLCGGQSNMELPLSRTRNGDEVIKSAHNPEIRFYKVAGHAHYLHPRFPKANGKFVHRKPPPTPGDFRRLRIFLRGGCRNTFTCRSDWLKIAWAELRPRPGPAGKHCTS